MSLSSASFAKFANDDEDDKALYLIISSSEDEDSFKVTKSGAYYYLPTSLMFDAFGYDYKRYNIMFDLVRISELDELLGGNVYKLNKRVLMRKEKKTKE